MTTIPDTAKKPTDRQPKADQKSLRKVTVHGLDIEVDRDVLDDFELLSDLQLAEDGQIQVAPSILRRIAGAEQYKALLDLARDKDTGRVSLEAGLDVVRAIFDALNEVGVPNS